MKTEFWQKNWHSTYFFNFLKTSQRDIRRVFPDRITYKNKNKKNKEKQNIQNKKNLFYISYGNISHFYPFYLDVLK